MSENVEKLRMAIGTAVWFMDSSRADAALAAVEQELAALEAERDELKKRPTLEEVDAFMIERGGWMCVEDFWHVRELFGKPIPADIKAALQ